MWPTGWRARFKASATGKSPPMREEPKKNPPCGGFKNNSEDLDGFAIADCTRATAPLHFRALFRVATRLSLSMIYI